MMKKIIALALALSMALSMVAFAGYTDAAEINKDLTADVELAGALGLMTGNPDGSFNPAGTLTRAEAAVIIYRLHSGKSTIDASWGDAALSTFTDMADHWSAAYVNYGAALGLITGYTDGTYRPENDVTVAEMAKLLLTVLGYSTEKQGYGKNWPMSVLADATVAGLLNEYEQAFTGKATREWVAKMLVNMLDANNVAYSQLTGTLTSSGLGQFGDKYDVTSVKVTAKANAVLALDGSEAAGKGKATLGTATVKYDLPAELVGRTVKVYFKGASLTNDSKIYTVVDASKSVTTTLDKIELKKATFDGNEYAKHLYVDGVATKGKDTDLTTLYVNLNKQDAALASWKSAKKMADTREITLVDNDANGKYDTIFMNEVEYGTVSAIDTEKKTATVVVGGDTISVKEKDTAIVWEDVNFVDAVAKNDVIRVETTFNAKGEAVYNVSKVNALRTKIASAVPADNKFVVGGVNYTVSAAALSDFNMTTFVNGLDKAALKNNTYDIYTDGKYVIYAKKYTASSTEAEGLVMEIAYLIAAQSKSVDNLFASATTTDYVQVMFADGTIGVYEYAIPSGVKADASIAFAENKDEMLYDTVYEYVLNDDGTLYFTEVADVESASADKAAIDTTNTYDYTANKTVATSYLTDGNNKLFANENTFFFAKHTYTPEGKSTAVTKYLVVKASEFEKDSVFTNWTFAKHTAYTKDSKTGLNTLVYGVMAGTQEKLPAPVAGAEAGEYFVVLKAGKEIVSADGSTWAIEGVNSKGEKETLTVTKIDAELVVGKVYTITTKDKDTYLAAFDGKAGLVTLDGANELAKGKWHKATITASNGSVVLLNDKSGEMVNVAADATVIALNTKDGAITLGSASSIPFGSKTTYVKLDKDGNVTDVVLFYYWNATSEKYEQGNVFSVFMG